MVETQEESSYIYISSLQDKRVAVPRDFLSFTMAILTGRIHDRGDTVLCEVRACFQKQKTPEWVATNDVYIIDPTATETGFKQLSRSIAKLCRKDAEAAVSDDETASMSSSPSPPPGSE